MHHSKRWHQRQKAALNQVINLSVLDGWWQEGYNGANGWGIQPLPGRNRYTKHKMLMMPNSFSACLNRGCPAVLPARILMAFHEGWLHIVKETSRPWRHAFAKRMVKGIHGQLYARPLRALRASGSMIVRKSLLPRGLSIRDEGAARQTHTARADVQPSRGGCCASINPLLRQQSDGHDTLSGRGLSRHLSYSKLPAGQEPGRGVISMDSSVPAQTGKA